MASGTAKYKYETDNGNFFYARTDNSPALAYIRGTVPTGAITESITFKVSRTSKELGYTPRHVTLYLDVPNTSVDCLINPKTVIKITTFLYRLKLIIVDCNLSLHKNLFIFSQLYIL